MITKNEILEACNVHVQKRMDQIKMAIDDANHSIREDTKSSAGDKYETSREMIQQDLSRYQQQLQLILQDQQLLQRIAEQNSVPQLATQGSIVYTESGIYFIAISIGEVRCSDKKVFVVSLQSPIGQVLKGKAVGDSFSFRNIQDEKIIDLA